jgi:hypothetical protein
VTNQVRSLHSRIAERWPMLAAGSDLTDRLHDPGLCNGDTHVRWTRRGVTVPPVTACALPAGSRAGSAQESETRETQVRAAGKTRGAGNPRGRRPAGNGPTNGRGPPVVRGKAVARSAFSGAWKKVQRPRKESWECRPGRPAPSSVDRPEAGWPLLGRGPWRHGSPRTAGATPGSCRRCFVGNTYRTTASHGPLGRCEATADRFSGVVLPI